MAYEHNPDSGTLFVNDRKDKESQPDFRGEGLVNGTPVWIAAWKKRSKNGTAFLSLSVKPKDGAWTNAKPASSDPWDDTPPAQSEDDYGARRDAFDL